ncbi:MAG: fimbrillin family protein [Paraprevotella sp.]|nr:fimbrillin family protein [Paraprevotella sp.]
MKTRNFFIWATVLATASLTACSNDDENTLTIHRTFPADSIIRVATNVDNLKTRAGMTTNTLTSFDLNITNPKSDNYSYTVKMKNENSVWNAYNSGTLQQMLWQDSSTPVSVTAAYLGGHDFTKEELTGANDATLTLDTDQSTDENMQNCDLLGMATTSVDPSHDLTTDGKMKVTLKHALSKLKQTLTLGTEFNMTEDGNNNGTDTNPITSVYINGTKVNYTYTGNTMDVAASTDATPSKISAYGTSYTAGSGDTKNAVANYECILVPQTVDASKFSVIINMSNGKSYGWISTEAVALEAGNQYELSLNVGKGTVTMGSITASDWDDQGSSDLTTD